MGGDILEAVRDEIFRNLSDAEYLEQRLETLADSGVFSISEIREIIESCRCKAETLRNILANRSKQ
ncbi:hypothetical protein [Leisingera caerulea]|uniref:hypothetical protein n=1 Tax=Leisingera caerulea TaxID=506591 RepID=UPI0021A555D5|nr:hypothetical protein [Leisingera caerulea]UWQ84773.1 hypothetical protein K3726_06110 [Leisingera caerulea]